MRCSSVSQVGFDPGVFLSRRQRGMCWALCSIIGKQIELPSEYSHPGQHWEKEEVPAPTPTDTSITPNTSLLKLPWPGSRYLHRAKTTGEGKTSQSRDIQGANPKADPVSGLQRTHPPDCLGLCTAKCHTGGQKTGRDSN